MKILLLFGITLMATVGSRAQQAQAEKTPEAPAAGSQATPPAEAPASASGGTAHPDQPRRATEHARQNDDAIYCYEPSPELEAHLKIMAEKNMRERCWQTIQRAKFVSSQLKAKLFQQQIKAYHQRTMLARQRGEKVRESPPRLGGSIPHLLAAIPPEPAK